MAACIWALAIVVMNCHQNFSDIDRRAQEEWRRHEQVLEQSIRGTYYPDQLLETAIFFQNLTGISLRVDVTGVGLMPNSKTPEDLHALREWYSRNKAKLYWDDESRSVKLRQEATKQ